MSQSVYERIGSNNDICYENQEYGDRRFEFQAPYVISFPGCGTLGES